MVFQIINILATRIKNIIKQLNIHQLSINSINNNVAKQSIKIKDISDKLQSEINKIKRTILTLNTRITTNTSDILMLKNDSNNISYIPTNILSKINKSVCQIIFIINNERYIGSGFFLFDTNTDLSSGYFITAAHCVMSIEEEIYKTTTLYLQNPINSKWTSINVNNIYIDGIADIALIKTDINLTNYPHYCLKLSNDDVNNGDICYVVGNPGNLDEDSISGGFIRDANYCDSYGYQITNSILVNAPGIGGNSGGPIINKNGDVVGIYTFGYPGTGGDIGGGSNKEVLKSTFTVLKQGIDNKTKLYLGLDWDVPFPFVLKDYYLNENEFDTMGVYIYYVGPLSPFNNILSENDILLSCIIGNTTIDFGNKENQRTPGILIYYPVNTVITIRYIKSNTNTIITTNVTLDKTYNDVSNLLDGPLQKGSRKLINAKITNEKIRVDYF